MQETIAALRATRPYLFEGGREELVQKIIDKIKDDPNLDRLYKRAVRFEMRTQRLRDKGLLSWEAYLRRKAVWHAVRAVWRAKAGLDIL